jgi:N-acetyl-anhydromuramyl-L-alanine amidase AmpD
MNEHYGMTPEIPMIEPKMVVLHWTAIPTFAGSFEAFYPALLPASREKIATASVLNVSVPYLIDRDGSIYQLMPDTLCARHVIGLNYCAIGVENVGDGDEYPLTEAQLASNINLVRYLAVKYDIQYVIGHHEYKKFIGHSLWKEKDPNYLTEKSDPGDEFMQKVRSQLSDLNLKPLPGSVGTRSPEQ